MYIYIYRERESYNDNHNNKDNNDINIGHGRLAPEACEDRSATAKRSLDYLHFLSSYSLLGGKKSAG